MNFYGVNRLLAVDSMSWFRRAPIQGQTFAAAVAPRSSVAIPPSSASAVTVLCTAHPYNPYSSSLYDYLKQLSSQILSCLDDRLLHYLPSLQLQHYPSSPKPCLRQLLQPQSPGLGHQHLPGHHALYPSRLSHNRTSMGMGLIQMNCSRNIRCRR